jgi:hypothetical protein
MPLEWCWTYKIRKDCEDCPLKPKPELVNYAAGKYHDKVYEYSRQGTGSEDDFTEKDGVFTTGPHKGEYMYHKKYLEIGCYWLVCCPGNSLQS